MSFSPELPFSQQQLRGFTPLATGDVFFLSRVLSARDGAAEQDRRPEVIPTSAACRARTARGSRERGLQCGSGGEETLAEVEVTGNRRTMGEIEREAAGARRASQLSREELLGAQHRLYRLGIFSNVRMETSPLTQAGDGTAQLLRVASRRLLRWISTWAWATTQEVGPKGQPPASPDNNVGGYDAPPGGADPLAARRSASCCWRRSRALLQERRPAGHGAWEDTEETGFSNDQWSTAVRLEQKFKPRNGRGTCATSYQRNDVYDVGGPARAPGGGALDRGLPPGGHRPLHRARQPGRSLSSTRAPG